VLQDRCKPKAHRRTLQTPEAALRESSGTNHCRVSCVQRDPRAPVDARGVPAIVDVARPHLHELKEAERALARAAGDLKSADSQVIILSRSQARLDERRDTLVEQVLNAKSQASVQKSSSGQATLLRIARQREQELREFDERFGHLWGQLAAARRDLKTKRSQLGLMRKRVSDLEAATGRFLPLAAQAEYDAGARLSRNHNPTGALRPESSNGHEVPHSHDDEDAVLFEDREPATHARRKRAARGGGIVTMIRKRVRRIRRPRRTRAGRIVRTRRQ